MEGGQPIPPAVRRALPALLLVMFLGAVDQTAMSAALPSVAGDLGGPEHMPAIVAAYLVAATVAMPAAGILGDRLGHRRVLAGGVLVFLAGAVVCAAAGQLWTLIAARSVQGVGGGVLMIGAQAVIGELVSPRERGRYLAVIGVAFMAAAVTGPVLGGAIVDAASWRWIFVGYVPLAVLAFVAVLRGIRLPPVLRGRKGFPWELVRDRSFSLAVAMSFLVGFAMFSVIAYVPAYLQIALGLSATQSGAVLVLLVAALLTTAVGSGVLIARTGRYRVFPRIGTLTAGGGLALIAVAGTGGGLAAALGGLVLVGLGIGFTMQVLVMIGQNAATRETLGVATSAVAFVRQVGAAAGVALVGAAVTAGFRARLPAEAAAVLGDRSGALGPAAIAGLPRGAAADVAAAYGGALTSVLLLPAVLLGLAAVLALLLPDRPLRTEAFADGGTGESAQPGSAQPENPVPENTEPQNTAPENTGFSGTAPETTQRGHHGQSPSDDRP
ncbi:MFS transporter [Sinomonas halotolerans]|uniref:MFS transporter n=1 Tax=Sinomonas halotolerans TaxID=1644133 RepID=A0ABU9X0Q3_9MICC